MRRNTLASKSLSVAVITAATAIGGAITGGAASAEQLNTLLSKRNANVGDECRLHYEDGTRIECPEAGVNLRLNFLVQPSYKYTSYEDQAVRGLRDNNSFDVDRARIAIRGDALDKMVSFMLDNDFAGDRERQVIGLPVRGATNERSSGLQDAWVQLNYDDQNGLRAGQFRAPYSLQNGVYEAYLQLPRRALTTQHFGTFFDTGVMALLGSDEFHLATSLTNGGSLESEDRYEAQNRTGIDPNLRWNLQAGMTSAGYDRQMEGDIKNSEEVEYTIAPAVFYEENHVLAEKLNVTGVNGSLGIKYAGFSAQSEVNWQQYDPDSGDKYDDIGFYIQTGYFVVPHEWEIAGRFGLINFDDVAEVNDVQEYTVGLGRYFGNHMFKVQTALTWQIYDVDAISDDTTDLIAMTQFSGYF